MILIECYLERLQMQLSMTGYSGKCSGMNGYSGKCRGFKRDVSQSQQTKPFSVVVFSFLAS